MKIITLEGDNWDSLAFTVKHGDFIFTTTTVIVSLGSKYDYFSSTDGTDIREVTVMKQSFDKFDSLPFDCLSIDETPSIKAFNAVVIRCGTIKGV